MRVEIDRLRNEVANLARPPVKRVPTPDDIAAVRAVEGFGSALYCLGDSHRAAARALGNDESTLRDWLTIAPGRRQLPARAISKLALTSLHAFAVWVHWQIKTLPVEQQRAFATSLRGLVDGSSSVREAAG
jgi:hypothetical protein